MKYLIAFLVVMALLVSPSIYETVSPAFASQSSNNNVAVDTIAAPGGGSSSGGSSSGGSSSGGSSSGGSSSGGSSSGGSSSGGSSSGGSSSGGSSSGGSSSGGSSSGGSSSGGSSSGGSSSGGSSSGGSSSGAPAGGNSGGSGLAPMCPFCQHLVYHDVQIQRDTYTTRFGQEQFVWTLFCDNCGYTTERDSMGNLETPVNREAQAEWGARSWSSYFPGIIKLIPWFK